MDGAWRGQPTAAIRSRLSDAGKAPPAAVGRPQRSTSHNLEAPPEGTGTARISPGSIQRKNPTNQRRASLRPKSLSNIVQTLSATRNGSTGRVAERPPCGSRARKASCSRTRASSDGAGMPVRGCCRLLGRSRPVVSSPWACDTDWSPHPSAQGKVPSRLPATVILGDWGQDLRLD